MTAHQARVIYATLKFDGNLDISARRTIAIMRNLVVIEFER